MRRRRSRRWLRTCAPDGAPSGSASRIWRISGASVRFVRNLEHGKPSVRLDKLLAVLDVLGLELRAGDRGR